MKSAHDGGVDTAAELGLQRGSWHCLDRLNTRESEVMSRVINHARAYRKSCSEGTLKLSFYC